MIRCLNHLWSLYDVAIGSKAAIPTGVRSTRSPKPTKYNSNNKGSARYLPIRAQSTIWCFQRQSPSKPLGQWPSSSTNRRISFSPTAIYCVFRTIYCILGWFRSHRCVVVTAGVTVVVTVAMPALVPTGIVR